MRKIDTVVGGGGQAGLHVLAVDRGGYGTDTLSTHALMRGVVVQLARWGQLDQLERAGTAIQRRGAHASGVVYGYWCGGSKRWRERPSPTPRWRPSGRPQGRFRRRRSRAGPCRRGRPEPRRGG